MTWTLSITMLLQLRSGCRARRIVLVGPSRHALGWERCRRRRLPCWAASPPPSTGSRLPEKAWRLRKARELVKLLALAAGHRLHREQVMDVLWRDREPGGGGEQPPPGGARRAARARRRGDRAAGRGARGSTPTSTSTRSSSPPPTRAATGTPARLPRARSRSTAASCCRRTATTTGPSSTGASELAELARRARAELAALDVRRAGPAAAGATRARSSAAGTSSASCGRCSGARAC